MQIYNLNLGVLDVHPHPEPTELDTLFSEQLQPRLKETQFTRKTL